MKYYQKPDNSVWAFESDGSQDALITPDMSAMSDADVLLHLTPAPAPAKRFTSLEYLDLFTDAEQLAVVAATMVNANIKLWYDKMLAAGFITIADPRTEAGLSALVGAGLLTAERKAEIIEAMS